MKVSGAYSVLGVPAGASGPDVRRAYRAELRRHHPDTGSGDVAALLRTRRAYGALLRLRPELAERARRGPSPADRPHVDVYA